MVENDNKNQPVKRVFFWQIPGDVPGYRTQPDPFQSTRTLTDAGYQFSPHLDTQKIFRIQISLARMINIKFICMPWNRIDCALWHLWRSHARYLFCPSKLNLQQP